MNACTSVYNYCADACLDEDNPKKMADCIRTGRECAAICEATAKVLAQKSKLSRCLQGDEI